MDWQYTLNNDPDYHKWLEQMDKTPVKSCAECRYSLKQDQFNLQSSLYCFNSECSHVGSHWTSCSDSRHVDYGLCGTDAKFFKPKVER